MQGEKMDRVITERIKDFLKEIEKLQSEAPCIFIDDAGNYWLNTKAKEFIASKETSLKDFMEWLKIGISHLKNLSFEDIKLDMIHLPDNNTMVFLQQMKDIGKNAKMPLTLKEREVLSLVSKGFTNKQIAESLKISPSTVNVHLDHIYRKLGCSNRVAACFIGLKKGLFPPMEH